MINMNRILIETYLVFSSSLFLEKIFVKIRKPFFYFYLTLISQKNINKALEFSLRNQEILL